MEGSHRCLWTCSNVAANGRLESLCILWCMCILTCFVDALDMAYVHEPIYTSTVSASDTIHTHSKNIWLCSSNSISPPSWDTKSWCRRSWKWWRVFKTKDAVFFIVIQGPHTCGALSSSLSSRSSQFFVVFSIMSSLWHVSRTRTPLLDWTWFGSGSTSFFFLLVVLLMYWEK